MRMMGQVLNRFLFGSSIVKATDVISAWNAVLSGYVLNLIIVFVSVAAIMVALGHYHPFIAPLDEADLRLILAIANPITFLLTFIASLQWYPSDQAIERQRTANRSRGEYLMLLTLLWGASLIFLTATLVVPSVLGVLAGATVHSALFQLMVSQRAIISQS
ncbi:hypothetical protein JQ609_29075 [Bradyrhizobium sp. AUGA SZCCT0169]|uniref:hypothetical protein n=1 Tax=Bradyrhizobium sp. AUGA SZCCT0169 TaxID=2807663 RepID=UPI001BA53940|nr:hypothetical protein [Bradyrhizobium sp. AUGA SZCCT0169]MBR1250959.1 hypothetical protein [Bradyrhizobium sp. AUGA SZCCT0169]